MVVFGICAEVIGVYYYMKKAAYYLSFRLKEIRNFVNELKLFANKALYRPNSL